MSTEAESRPFVAAEGTPTRHLVRPHGGGTLALFEYFTITARRYFKVSFFSQIGAPLLYLLSLGVGLGSVVNSGSGSASLGTGYLSFIAPALIAAPALQVAVGEATFPILHGGFRYQRTYFGMNATPLTGGRIAYSVLAWIALRAGLSALLYLIVVACFGGLRSVGVVLCIPIAVLGAMALAAPIAALSATLENDAGVFPALFRFVVTPMFLFSGTFYPISTLPTWARDLAWISPLWHATELSRWAALGPLHLRSGVGHLSGGAAVAHLVFLLALIAAGAALTGWRFRVRLAR